MVPFHTNAWIWALDLSSKGLLGSGSKKEVGIVPEGKESLWSSKSLRNSPIWLIFDHGWGPWDQPWRLTVLASGSALEVDSIGLGKPKILLAKMGLLFG